MFKKFFFKKLVKTFHIENVNRKNIITALHEINAPKLQNSLKFLHQNLAFRIFCTKISHLEFFAQESRFSTALIMR